MSVLRGKNVLVAGGAGLVGTHVVARCLQDGAFVRASFCSRPPSQHAACYERYDFTEFEDCLKATRDIDYAVLCAAKVYAAGVMRENPTAAILPNLTINAGLLEACHLNNVARVVYVSSTTVYPLASHALREDELDLNVPPFELYRAVGAYNRYMEQLAQTYHARNKVAVGIVRPTNVYGPFDHFDDERAHVLPALIRRADAKTDPFVVWGSGAAVRDFLYAEDLASDIVDVLDGYCTGDPVNTGSGLATSIRDLVDVVLEACGHTAAVTYDASKPESIPYRMVSLAKLHALFGGKPRVSLADGISRTVDWYRTQRVMKETA